MKTKFVIALLFSIFSVLFLSAQNATKWRGPEGNGNYNETGLLKQWPADGPEIAWVFEKLGDGFSSPVFANGLIYLSTCVDGQGFIYVLNKEGVFQWKAPYGKEFIQSYPGSRSTPVVDGDLMYMYSGHGVLYCMESKTGKMKWQKDGFNDFDGKNITWGVTETVVVNGDLVYFTPGGAKYNVVALNRFTGELVWSAPGLGEISAYCTPLLVDLKSRKILVTHTEKNILGLDAKTGKLLWSHGHTNRWAVHSNTPLFYNGGVFCFSGYGQGGVMLKLNADGSSVEKVWFNEKLDNRIGGMVVVDGYLYGSGDNSREWRCINWNTGEEKYASASIGKGVVIYADGMLYCYSEKGELALVKASPEGFNVISKAKVELGSAQHWAHPVINEGKLFLRHGNVLIAYKIK